MEIYKIFHSQKFSISKPETAWMTNHEGVRIDFNFVQVNLNMPSMT